MVLDERRLFLVYTKQNVIDALAAIGIKTNDKLFDLEPDTSLAKLKELELIYNINTHSIINSTEYIELLPKIVDEWKSLYSDFLMYGGLESNINNIDKSIENYVLGVDQVYASRIRKYPFIPSLLNESQQIRKQKVDKKLVHFYF